MDLGNTHRLKVFVAVAEARSFSKAARALLISQPSVSKRVRELEEIVGAPLFERRGRGVKLTELGDLVLRHGKEVIRALEEMEAHVEAATRGVAGRLELVISSIWEYSLPSVFASFRGAYPLVFIHAVRGHPRDAADRVLDGRAHLGFVGPAIDEPDLQALPVVQDELIIVALPVTS